MEYIENLELKLEDFKKTGQDIEFFNNIFLSYLRKDPEYVKELALRLIDICEKNNYAEACGYALYFLGWYYLDKIMYNEAEEIFNKAFKSFSKSNCEKGIAKCYNGLLALNSKKGNYSAAIEAGLKGIELCKNTNQEMTLTALMINTANIHVENKNYQLAAELFEDIIKNDRPILDANKFGIYSSLAQIYTSLGNMERAKEYVSLALALVKETNIKSCLGEIYLCKGNIEYEEGKLEEAYKSYKFAEKSALSFNVKDVAIDAMLAIAEILVKKKQYTETEEKINIAISMLVKSQSRNFKGIRYKKISEIFHKLGKTEEAYKYVALAYEERESTFEQDSKEWFIKLHKDLLENEKTLYKDLYNKIELISQIGRKIISALQFEDVYKDLHKNITTLVSADYVSIALANDKTTTLSLISLEINSFKRKEKINFLKEKTLETYSFNNGKSLLINDLKSEIKIYLPDNEAVEKKDVNSLICVPIELDKAVIGIIEVENKNKDAYTFQDLTVLKLISEYLSVAIKNASLFKEIKFLATHDSLTNIFSRAETMSLGEKEFLKAKEKENNISCIIFDIDKFKNINDTYGHLSGDKVLKDVCKIISKKIGRKNIFGRYGGEEFILILPGYNEKEALKFSEEIKNLIANNTFYDESARSVIKVTISLGVYEYKEEDENIYIGISRADKALYFSKNNGRNRSTVYTDKMIIN